MDQGQQVAIWLFDTGAKLFLGLDANGPVSRWVVVGAVLPLQDPSIGVWLDVKYVEEVRPGDPKERIRYGLKPGSCLIRWDFIITVQNLKNAEMPDEPRMGFRTTPP